MPEPFGVGCFLIGRQVVCDLINSHFRLYTKNKQRPGTSLLAYVQLLAQIWRVNNLRHFHKPLQHDHYVIVLFFARIVLGVFPYGSFCHIR